MLFAPMCFSSSIFSTFQNSAASNDHEKMVYYYFDISIVHSLIFILPCIILTLFKLWTKLVAKSQAEIISRKLNEELVKLV